MNIQGIPIMKLIIVYIVGSTEYSGFFSEILSILTAVYWWESTLILQAF